MATITVLDASGNPVAINEPLPAGRAAAAESNPVALSTEDSEALNSIAVVPGAVSGGSVGTSSAQLIAADATRQIVQIQNVSPTATIATSPGGTAVINGAGCDLAYPGGYVIYEGAAAQLAIDAISDTALTAVTIKVG